MLRATLRALSGGSPALRRALGAYGLYDIVEHAVWVAIVLYAFAEGGPSLVALVAVVQLLPAAVIAPLLASIGDRLPRGTALAIAHAGVAVTTATTAVMLLTEAATPVVVAASAATTTAISVVRPIHFAALPRLARGPDDLASANSLSSLADGGAQFVGPALAGLGVALAGPGAVLVGAAIAAAVATLLSLRLDLGSNSPRGDARTEETTSAWREAFAGLRLLSGDAGSLALLAVLATTFVIVGALDVLAVSYAQAELGSGESDAGLLIGAIGIGGLVGSLAGGWLARRRLLAPVVLAGGVLQGLGIAAVAGLGGLGAAMAAIAVAGVGATLLTVAGRTLLQRSTDDGVLARVFAVQEGTALLALAVGAAVAPTLIDVVSPAGAFLPLGVTTAVLTVVGVVLVRRLDARAVFLPEEVSLLRRVPFMAVLPAYELERLAHRARWVDVAAGAEVVRQGEPGDEFFVIAAGDFDVTVDGTAEAWPSGQGAQVPTLTVGDGFGEIALLHAVPRTATVTAQTPGRLLAVRADDFLAAVTGSADGGVIAAEVSAAHLARDRARDGARER